MVPTRCAVYYFCGNNSNYFYSCNSFYHKNKMFCISLISYCTRASFIYTILVTFTFYIFLFIFSSSFFFVLLIHQNYFLSHFVIFFILISFSTVFFLFPQLLQFFERWINRKKEIILILLWYFSDFAGCFAFFSVFATRTSSVDTIFIAFIFIFFLISFPSFVSFFVQFSFLLFFYIVTIPLIL